MFGIKKRDMQRVVSEVKRTCLLHRETMCADRLDQALTKSCACKIRSNYGKTQRWTTLRKVIINHRQRLNEWTRQMRDVIVRTLAII